VVGVAEQVVQSPRQVFGVALAHARPDQAGLDAKPVLLPEDTPGPLSMDSACLSPFTDMPYTIEEFNREFFKRYGDEILERMTPEQRVKGLSADELERLLHQKRQEEAAAARKKGKRPGRRPRKQ
jgi:hypothetical protein